MPWPQGYKTFSSSTELGMKFIMPITVKILIIVGILTFIIIIYKYKAVFYFSAFYFLWADENSCSVELSMKKFYNIGAWLTYLVAVCSSGGCWAP